MSPDDGDAFLQKGWIVIEQPYDPATHYDRVTDAWTLLLGSELHYGVFETGSETLPEATARLTQRMIDAANIEPGVTLLDVGCGTGTQACRLAGEYGARVTGITTSEVGVEASRARAKDLGLSATAVFELRDATDNGFPDSTFDRVWVLESSHLMPARDRLLAECARVLKPGGRLALCDVMLQRPLPFEEVRRLRAPLGLLREVFGDARMEPLDRYEELAVAQGLVVESKTELTEVTRRTFAHWKENATAHRHTLIDSLGEADLERFVEACDVLEGFWGDGTLGYGLLAASKP
ncbi:MAG TPA: class I SAM-dependent methyltransferase [Actinomycetota bacterium]|nr:class I SAM-dependent methyltransferase [Actinomycetota bacterium]